MSRFRATSGCFCLHPLVPLFKYGQDHGGHRMSCGCSVQEPLNQTEESPNPLNIPAIVEANISILNKGAASRQIRFPELRELYGKTELISTFSHLNINLPIDEVYGNYVLKQIADGLGLAHDRILNVAYDNIHPGNDAPKGHKVQYVIINPDVLEAKQVVHLQEALNYDPESVVKNGQNRIKSVPEQNIDSFRHRFDQIDEILQKHSGSGNVADRILAVRNDYLELLSCDFVPERAFSQSITSQMADVLEWLFNNGYPFWEMPVPEHQDRYLEHTFLVEGLDSNGHRQPASFVDQHFVFSCDGAEKRIPQDKIFDALRNLEVIPTMPLVILTTATAPQLPHLGGGVWKGYASVHLDAQAEWLNIDERSDTLILSTEGHKPLTTYRQNQEFTGFPAIYLTYGPDMICNALDESSIHRVEFKRIVY